jgi:hypothetical protein
MPVGSTGARISALRSIDTVMLAPSLSTSQQHFPRSGLSDAKQGAVTGPLDDRSVRLIAGCDCHKLTGLEAVSLAMSVAGAINRTQE